MRNKPIIALIDMDCFYVQVELKNAPLYRGKPSAVVQYNTWRGGGIIAVSYEARDKGVTRAMRGEEAVSKCPEIHLFSVPELRGKADLSRYRNAGADVMKCLSSHASLVERASIDEAYIDLSDEIDNLLIAAPDDEETESFWRSSRDPQSNEGCHSIGYDSYADWLDYVWRLRDSDNDQIHDDIRLCLGSYLVTKMREEIFKTLGYRCSAGIAHSKVVAKYACGVHKPNQQTLVSSSHVSTLFMEAPIHKIRNLGGKLGKIIQERLNVDTIGQLSSFSLKQLSESFGDKTGPWLYSLCRGSDDEGVVSRQLAQSIGCSKNFPGANMLDSVDKVRHWVTQMAQEIVERVNADRESNGRVPSHLCVNYRQLRLDLSDKRKRSVSGSRVVPAGSLTVLDITTAVLVVLSGINSAGHRDLPPLSWHPPLLSLGISAGKFRPQLAKNDISRFLVDASVTPSSLSAIGSRGAVCEGDGDSSTLLPPPVKPEATESSGHCFIIPQEEQKEEQEEEQLSAPQTKKVKKMGFFARRLEREEREAEEGGSRLSVDSDYMKCDKCSRMVSMWEAPEHSDWHLAMEVQRTLSRELFLEEQQERKKKTGVAVGQKAKTTGKQPLKRKTKDETQRTIESYFSK